MTCDLTPPGSPRYLKLPSSHGQLERASMGSCESRTSEHLLLMQMSTETFGFVMKSATADSEWANNAGSGSMLQNQASINQDCYTKAASWTSLAALANFVWKFSKDLPLLGAANCSLATVTFH